MIGCSLLFAFEILQGNDELAKWHAKGGYQLIQNWMMKRIDRFRGSLISSPTPIVLEDDILDAFYHLDLQIMTISHGRSVEVHTAGQTDSEDLMERMPAEFSDLNEAYRYWVLIMRRNSHFCHYIWAMMASAKSTDGTSTGPATPP
jgi:hypothetical protein